MSNLFYLKNYLHINRIIYILNEETQTKPNIMSNDFDNKLRNKFQKYLDTTSVSIYRVAKDLDIIYPILHRFITDGDAGMSGENCYKLMGYLKINVGDL